jgi:hypothetical protein
LKGAQCNEKDVVSFHKSSLLFFPFSLFEDSADFLSNRERLTLKWCALNKEQVWLTL